MRTHRLSEAKEGNRGWDWKCRITRSVTFIQRSLSMEAEGGTCIWEVRGFREIWWICYWASIVMILSVCSQVLASIPVKWNDGVAEFQINETLLYLVFTTLCVFELNDIVILSVIYLKILQHKQCETVCVCVCVCVCVQARAHFILYPRGCPLTSEVPSSGTHTSLVSIWQTLIVHKPEVCYRVQLLLSPTSPKEFVIRIRKIHFHW